MGNGHFNFTGINFGMSGSFLRSYRHLNFYPIEFSKMHNIRSSFLLPTKKMVGCKITGYFSQERVYASLDFLR